MVGVIAPSAELDAAVAKACGWRHYDEDRHQAIPPDGEYTYRDVPKPSIDLNAAFEAAEKVGLFENWHLGKGCNGWYFVDDYENPLFVDGKVLSRPTPALVICAAILNLEGAK